MRSLAADDRASMLNLDYFADHTGGVVSVSVRLHASPRSKNFQKRCREVMGYVLAAMDQEQSEVAMHQLDDVLQRGDTANFEVKGVMFRILINTDRGLEFDFHSKGF